MNNVNRVATYLRQKLAAITDLANLELGRAAATGKARLKAGPGVPVTDGDEAMEAEYMLDTERNERDPMSAEFSATPGDVPYKPEEVEDPETMRLVYEMVDRTVRGQGHKTPMSSSLRSEIAQAVIGLLRKPRAGPPQGLDEVDPDAPTPVKLPEGVKKVLHSDVVEELQKHEQGRLGTNAPIEAGDERGGSRAAIVSKVLEEIRSAQAMGENKQQVNLLGFADPILAPTFAANLASVLGAVTATRCPVAVSVLRRPPNSAQCSSFHASQRAHAFLLSAGTRAPVKRGAPPRSQQQRDANINFF